MTVYEAETHWTLYNVPMNVRFWSGVGDLEFEGETWNGVRSPNNDAAFMGISSVEFSQDDPNRRAQITLDASNIDVRNQLLQDFGPLTIVLSWIYSEDKGVNWLRVPRSFIGRLSNPVIEGGLYTVDIETYTGDRERIQTRMWSHSTQQREYPGDLGLIHTANIASGFQTTWPP